MRSRPSPPPRSRPTPFAAIGALVAALLLAGCAAGGDGPEPDPSAGGSERPSATPADPGADPDPGAVSSYVALGDSYTSAPLVPRTDVAAGCFRSDGNYPAQVAKALGAELTDVSCAGADTTDVRRPQLDGVAPQARALARDADLVTVSLGGNDGGVFSTLVGQCGRGGAGAMGCTTRFDPGTEPRLRQRLQRTGADLTRVLRLAARRAPDAKVLAVGYPTIVSADRTCEALPLPPEAQAAAARLNVELNDTVREAARRAGATFVDVAGVTADHDICAEDPWVNGAVTDQQRALAFHPFAAEQEAVAQAVLDAVRR